jgi:hypothetical protein
LPGRDLQLLFVFGGIFTVDTTGYRRLPHRLDFDRYFSWRARPALLPKPKGHGSRRSDYFWNRRDGVPHYSRRCALAKDSLLASRANVVRRNRRSRWRQTCFKQAPELSEPIAADPVS